MKSHCNFQVKKVEKNLGLSIARFPLVQKSTTTDWSGSNELGAVGS